MTELSEKRAGTAVIDEVVAACAPWSAVVRAGQKLQIIDLHGNQAVDTLFYGFVDGRPDPALRYCAQATVAAQRNIFLTTDSVLRAADGTALMTIVADEVMFELRPYRPLQDADVSTLQAAASRYGVFLGRGSVLDVR